MFIRSYCIQYITQIKIIVYYEYCTGMNTYYRHVKGVINKLRNIL